MRYLIPALFVASAAVAEQHTTPMTANLAMSDGTSVGSVEVMPTASGEPLITLSLSGLPAGEHAVHIHETGDCSADDFSSAGGHMAGDKDHGVMSANGPHPGDLPNVMVGEDGLVEVTFFGAAFDMAMMQDDDGSAFIVHEGADDYTSQPSGDAGGRIACGVFE